MRGSYGLQVDSPFADWTTTIGMSHHRVDHVIDDVTMTSRVGNDAVGTRESVDRAAMQRS